MSDELENKAYKVWQGLKANPATDVETLKQAWTNAFKASSYEQAQEMYLKMWETREGTNHIPTSLQYVREYIKLGGKWRIRSESIDTFKEQ